MADEKAALISPQTVANAKLIVSTAASLAASAVLIRAIVNDFLPSQFHTYLTSRFHSLSRRFSFQLTIVVEEFQGFAINQVFEAAEIYLGSLSNISVQRIRVGKTENEMDLAVSVDSNEEVVDVFEGKKFKWKLITTQVEASSRSGRNQEMGDLNSSLRSEVRSFELTFNKKHKEKVFKSYFPYLLERAKAIREQRKTVKIHNFNPWEWCYQSFNLNHPMNFDTIAVDSELKRELLEDLDNFINGKDYYKKIGKVWKRGYLLYGPPGTGKTSLIAAMANHLKFDIYDLDLNNIQGNTQLKNMLLSISSRSIIVIEDIDCSIKLQNRDSEDQAQNEGNSNKVTLSGLLNFVDELYSCCGEGRIMVFTTNYKDKLDSALIRPGRMDMHICLSYCNASGFEQLAFNYLGIHGHALFDEIKGLLKEIEVTPAEVAGELVKSRDPDTSLQGFLSFLHNKRNQ